MLDIDSLKQKLIKIAARGDAPETDAEMYRKIDRKPKLHLSHGDMLHLSKNMPKDQIGMAHFQEKFKPHLNHLDKCDDCHEKMRKLTAPTAPNVKEDLPY